MVLLISAQQQQFDLCGDLEVKRKLDAAFFESDTLESTINKPIDSCLGRSSIYLWASLVQTLAHRIT